MKNTRYLQACLHAGARHRPAVFEAPASATTGEKVRNRGRLIAMKVDGVWSIQGLVEVRDRRYIELLESTPWADDEVAK